MLLTLWHVNRSRLRTYGETEETTHNGPVQLGRPASTRCGLAFQLGQPGQRLSRVVAAHLWLWPQPHADYRSLRPAKQPAAIVGRQLNAAHPGRFARRHAGDGAADRRRDTARAAARATIETVACVGSCGRVATHRRRPLSSHQHTGVHPPADATSPDRARASSTRRVGRKPGRGSTTVSARTCHPPRGSARP